MRSGEGEKSKRILPKFSSITLTSLDMSNGVLGEQSQNKPTMTNQLNSRLLNQKQLIQMDIYISSMRRKILAELNEFIDFVDEQIITRNKWQSYSA